MIKLFSSILEVATFLLLSGLQTLTKKTTTIIVLKD
jgi:hypothetical protein